MTAYGRHQLTERAIYDTRNSFQARSDAGVRAAFGRVPEHLSFVDRKNQAGQICFHRHSCDLPAPPADQTRFTGGRRGVRRKTEVMV